MEFFVNNILITVLLPLWVVLTIISGVFFKYAENRKLTALLTLFSTFIGMIFALCILKYTHSTLTAPVETNYLWFGFQNINFYLGTYTDKISSVFLAILMIISFIVQLYSYGYMKNKEDFNRYFVYLNLFNFSMTGLILSTNLLQMYVFWELVGVISYLLVGFYYKKEDVSLSAKKVFIINRIGDCAFLLGIIMLSYFSIFILNISDGSFLMFSSSNTFLKEVSESAYPVIWNIILLLLIIGAIVKSAQFPFQQWLIEAMKAPSPVSALIHSATMVCMGIFLIIRIYPLLTPYILKLIIIIGLITALFNAFIAISQNNIKKMLAYSTSSQLGFMFTALGLGFLPIAIIYLVIHSFTKALLFLNAGQIEMICNTLNMNETPPLRKYNINLAILWLISALSLSGLFFGGFNSKELLLNSLHNSGNNIILFLILLTSFFSAFYIFKAYFFIFETDFGNKNITVEKDFKITSAMMLMSVFVILPGFIFKLSNLNLLCAISVIIGIIAVFNAYICAKSNKIFLPAFLLKLSCKELYIPEIYNFISSVFLKFTKLFFYIEKFIFDFISEITAKIIQKISLIISRIQNGNIQSYISYSLFTTGVIFMILVLSYIFMRGV